MKKIFIHLGLMLAVALLFSMPLQAQSGSEEPYVEGLHYFKIEGSTPTPQGSAELVEAFSYMCTHCNTFEPYIQNWVTRNAGNVKFNRIPVVFGRKAWEIYARAYVTAEMLKLGDDVHAAMMDKIWKQKAVMRSMEELAEFYSDFGADPEVFLNTSKSFAVDAKMRKDQKLTRTYGIRGTPTLVVNGKYRVTSGAAVPSYDVMLDVVDYLIAEESKQGFSGPN
jgi:thiol:disulfide interchange protein DsbA